MTTAWNTAIGTEQLSKGVTPALPSDFDRVGRQSPSWSVFPEFIPEESKGMNG